VSHSNAKTGYILGGVAAGMLGLAFAAVPLYQIFCQVTGFGGTPITVDDNTAQISDETITVRFDASVDRRLDWDFKPVQREMTVRLGETNLAFYVAHNPTDKPVIGSATFNIAPIKASPHFMKIDCFCFEEQLLAPGESVEMPVTFYVDPEIRTEQSTLELTSVTLSYTFYRQDGAQEAALAIPSTDAQGVVN